MANTIILKRSATPGKVPTTSQLALGEIAINTYDGLLYIKKDDGTPSVVQIGGVTSVNGETGSVTIDTGDVAENGNLYFTNARARAALSAGSGITYNSSTGAISTTQNLSTAGSPTFAGLTMTGDINMTGDIIPSADITYDLGSPDKQWKDIYVGPGSLYVNGSKVLQDDSGTIAFTADPDQNIRIKTLGNGILQLGSSTTTLQVDSTLQLTSGKRITDSAGVKVQFGDDIEMNNNKIVGLGAPSANTDAATKGYVDSQVSAISTSSITQGNSNISIADSGSGTVTVTVDGTTALTVDANGVTVAGNFTVSGTQTVVNSNTINLADNIITLNSDATGNPTQNAGLLIERGDEADTQIRWNEGTDKWTFTNDGSVYYPMATGTDDLAEGSTNLYFTQARARGAINASSSTGVSYNSTTGAISLGSIPNSSLANNSITINGTSVALGGTRTLDTDAISEGSSNLYHTTARARAAVSAGTGISYNSTTGVISTSAIPNASLANSAVTVGTTSVSLGSSVTTLAGLTSVTSTGFTGALTGNADTATSAGKWTTARTITLAGDLSGSVSIDGSANATLTATVAANSVALGTDTTGNYMVDVSAGTGITVTHTPGEGSTATVAVDTSTIATRSYVDSAVQGKDNTDEITEGSTNLFFTNGRARAALSAGGDLSYSSATGVISFTQNKAWSAITGTPTTLAGYGIANAYTKTEVDSAITNAVAGKDNTDEITEGATNQYFTTARARAAVSAGTGISYNSTTGVITNTITQYTDALAVSANASAIATAKSEAISAAAAANAATATKLATARTINGASFDGSANITFNTDATAEGSTNLYFTNARAVSANTSAIATAKAEAISAAAADATSKANAAQAAAIAAVTNGAGAAFDTLKEIQDAMATDTELASAIAAITNVPSATKLQTARTINGASFDGTANISFSTSAVSEGTNLYYTDARARAAHSFAAGSGAYNSSTGVITIPTNTNQLTNGAGFITGYTETDTLASVTGRGASTGSAISITNTTASSSKTTGALIVSGGVGVNGSMFVGGEVTAYASDASLKTNVVEIEDALAKVEAIRGVTYDWNAAGQALGLGKAKQVGVIAQEVAEVLPEVVVDSAHDGYKTVKYDKLTALLIEAVKELSAKVKTLEAQLNGKPGL